MLTYQVRPRTFRHEPGENLVFPNDVEVRFYFKPLQPFGMEAGNGHTAVRAVEATAFFDSNTGRHSIQSKNPLDPLNVVIEEPDRIASLQGNILTIRERFNDLISLNEVIQSIYFVIPMLLNIEFADPPVIERVEGMVGRSHFRWELSSWLAEFKITTQDVQESAVIQSWKRLEFLAQSSQQRRLIAALHYFHVACRLAHSGSTPGEFLAEVLLNLSKTLEVLFPPSGDGRSRDAIRRKLEELGYSNEDVEGSFIPAIALRNEIDVGHVELAIFKTDQLKILHSYTERAEGSFRELLLKVFDKCSSGEFEVAPYELNPPKSESVKIIERLRKYTPSETI